MDQHLLLEQLRALNSEIATKFEELIQQKQLEVDRLRTQLDLLERAVSADYDSILITELDLEFPGPKIVYANSGFTKLTGYTLDEVLGQTPRILQGPKTDRTTLDRLKKNLIDGQSFFGQTVNYRKDGSEFINQWDIHPLENEDGEITHWVSYQHDVTTRKTAEVNLGYDPDTNFDQLDELSKSILIDFDQQGNVLYANKAFREMTGHTMDSLKQIQVWELVELKEFSKTAFEKGIASKYETTEFVNSTFITHDESKLNVLIKAEWREVDGQVTLHMTIKNLTLQNRVLDAISRIKELSGKLNHNLDQIKPLHIVFSKASGKWELKDLKNTLTDYFPNLSTESTVDNCDLPKLENLDSWKEQLKKKNSICEFVHHNETAFTIYLKALNDHEIEYQLSLNHNEKTVSDL